MSHARIDLAARAALVLAAAACGAPTTPAGALPTATAADGMEAPDAVDPPADLRPLLERHNRLREGHCAPPLAWSPEVARAAQAWADELAGDCQLEHSGSAHGENLAAGTAGVLDAEGVVDLWYREIDHYDLANGGFSAKTGHFTQVVWVDTARLGCGRAACKGLQIWVCNYDPPGNVHGQYRENVRAAPCKR
jgi:uncharacterized protein YkwD